MEGGGGWQNPPTAVNRAAPVWLGGDGGGMAWISRAVRVKRQGT